MSTALAERPRLQLAPAPELKPTVDAFPTVSFKAIEIHGGLGFKFSLKNNDDLAKAKRAVDLARKMLADAGAEMTVVFDPPAQESK